jgi:hypothetical protein
MGHFMLRRHIAVFALLVCVVALSACKKKPVTIVGTWKGTSFIRLGNSEVTLIFNADGTMYETFNNDNYTGTWTINGNQLRIDAKSGGGELDDTEAFTLDGDELTIQLFQGSGNPITLSRE